MRVITVTVTCLFETLLTMFNIQYSKDRQQKQHSRNVRPFVHITAEDLQATRHVVQHLLAKISHLIFSIICCRSVKPNSVKQDPVHRGKCATRLSNRKLARGTILHERHRSTVQHIIEWTHR